MAGEVFFGVQRGWIVHNAQNIGEKFVKILHRKMRKFLPKHLQNEPFYIIIYLAWLHRVSHSVTQKICDEAKGCGRCVREFSWSMSDFKPGDCNTEHSMCLCFLRRADRVCFWHGCISCAVFTVSVFRIPQRDSDFLMGQTGNTRQSGKRISDIWRGSQRTTRYCVGTKVLPPYFD